MKVLRGPEGAETGEVGKWTVVYDQAIVVDLPGKHHAKYTANFRYTVKPGVSASRYDTLKNGSYESFNSSCDETMVGVKLGKDKMLQCWVGY